MPVPNADKNDPIVPVPKTGKNDSILTVPNRGDVAILDGDEDPGCQVKKCERVRPQSNIWHNFTDASEPQKSKSNRFKYCK